MLNGPNTVFYSNMKFVITIRFFGNKAAIRHEYTRSVHLQIINIFTLKKSRKIFKNPKLSNELFSFILQVCLNHAYFSKGVFPVFGLVNFSDRSG